MARFQFSLRCLVSQAVHHPVVAQRALQALHLDEAPEARSAQPHGPGWFDSSWDLVRGLDVREGLPGDARLHEWLAACLAPAMPDGALTQVLHVADSALAASAGVMHIDGFSNFGIDGLALV